MDTRRRRRRRNEVYLQNPFQNIPILPKRTTRVHAQRKFASMTGTTLPLKELKELKEKVSVNNEKKSKDSSHLLSHRLRDNVVMRPKTEDFLTFLCFRGTSVLPPHLECFESPQYTEQWSKSKAMIPLQENKPYKVPMRRAREEIGDNMSVKNTLEPIHVDINPLTSARVTRSSASLTPTPSFLSSPQSSECSPNHAIQRKLTKNQLLLKKAMLIKTKKALVKKRKERIIIKKQMASQAINSRVTRSGTQQVEFAEIRSGPSNVPKSPIMPCRKTVKASHVSKRKKSLCRMLNRIGIMVNSSDTTISRKTRSQSENSSFMPFPKKLDNGSTNQIQQQNDNNGQIGEEKLKKITFLKQKSGSTSKRQLTSNCSLSQLKSNMDKSALRQSLNRRLVEKQKRKLLTLVDQNQDCEPLPRKRKCLRNRSSDQDEIKSAADDSESNMTPRPARRTKQVAEVYLELFSQKMAKEAKVGLEVSDEEDNISIKKIKELTSVTTAKNELDMKKCVKEFTEKHDGQKNSPAKTPSPMRSRSSSETTPIRKHLIKRNLFHSDTEDSEVSKEQISKNRKIGEPKSVGSKFKTKALNLRDRPIKMETKIEKTTLSPKIKTHTDVIGRAMVRLSRLKSPQRNSDLLKIKNQASGVDREKSECSHAEIKCKTLLQTNTKVMGTLKETTEQSSTISNKVSYGKITTDTPAKVNSSSQGSSVSNISLRKIRSEKEIRRMATQFLESKCDLPLPNVKKCKDSSNSDKVESKEKPEISVKKKINSCKLVRRAFSLDDTNASLSITPRKSILGGQPSKEKTMLNFRSSHSKSVLKGDSIHCKKTKSSKQSRKPLRRKSLHDNTQLSEVLEKIAKDFEKQIDIGAHTKIETDLNSGNKSPVNSFTTEHKFGNHSTNLVSNHRSSIVCLKIPKVSGTKCLNEVIKNAMDKDLGEIISQEDNEEKKGSANKTPLRYSNKSPAKPTSPLREIQPKPFSKLSEGINEHCIPSSPLRNITLKLPVLSESTISAIEEPFGSREKLKAAPYLPEIIKSKLTTSLNLDSNVKAANNIGVTARQLPIPFHTHGIVLGGTTTLNMPLCQFQPAVIPPTLGHIGPSIAMTQPIITSINEFKQTKIETTPTKSNSKQILIAPKPNKNVSTNITGINSISGLKLYQKTIAPKIVPNNGTQQVSASHFQTTSPILTTPTIGSLVQTLQHPMQTVQTLSQTLHSIQSVPQGVQSVQTLNQNFQTIGALGPTVQGVIPQTLPLNAAHLGSQSSPAKLIAPPVFVSSSVPNMVAAPFDFTVGQLPGNGISSVAQVISQNVIGKVVPKCQPSIVTPVSHPLVTLGTAADGSIISSFVPINAPGQPQFLTVSMMPMVTSPLSVPATGLTPGTARMPPTVCSQSIGSSLSSLNNVITANLNAAIPISSNMTYSSVIPTGAIISSSNVSAIAPQLFKRDVDEKIFPTSDIQDKPFVSSNNDLEIKSYTLENDKAVKGTFKETLLDPIINRFIDQSEKQHFNDKIDLVSLSKAPPLLVQISSESSTSSYSPIEQSTTLSQASLEYSPLQQNITVQVSPISSLSTTSLQSLHLNTHIYTSASLISPQNLECGFSRQKAVTKVSQSSPPYLLSTSTSDVNNSMKAPVYKSSEPNLEMKSPKNENILCTVAKESFSIVAAKNSNIEASDKLKSKEPVVPLFSTKIFYSSKNKIQNKLDKMPAALLDKKSNDDEKKEMDEISDLSADSNKITAVNLNSNTVSNIDILKTSNSTPSTCFNKASVPNYQTTVSESIKSVSYSKHVTVASSKSICHSKPITKDCNKSISHSKPTKCNKVVSKSKSNIKEYSKPVSPQCSETISHVDNTQRDQRNIGVHKKEPLLKKTLFKHKSINEPKSAKAFSALNESSVYAFEPDKDILHVSTPFPKRLKRINSNEDAFNVNKSKISNEIKSKRDSPLNVPSTANLNVDLNKVDFPEKTLASNRLTKMDPSKIIAAAKFDMSSSSSFDETEDEDNIPLEIVSIAPVYSNSSAEEELICHLPTESKKEPVSLNNSIKPKGKMDNLLRSVRMNQPIISNPCVSLQTSELSSSKYIIKTLRNFKINSNLKRRKVARIPMNHSFGQMMGRFPPNSIQSISSANSILTSKATVTNSMCALPSNKGTMPSPSKLSHTNCNAKLLSNIVEKKKSIVKHRQDKNDRQISKHEIHSHDDKKSKNIKHPIQSTSIAIQCDLDENSNQEEKKPNESGTQTESPAKLSHPSSASPFYYLPLAMATLGEELPAQLVQQMLTKTQGVVGETEAKMILRQATHLAQQYHKNIDEEGIPSLPAASSAKPISPKSGSIALQKVLKATFSEAGLASLENSIAAEVKKKNNMNQSNSVSLKTSKKVISNEVGKAPCPEQDKKLIKSSSIKISKKVKELSVERAKVVIEDESSESSMEANNKGKQTDVISPVKKQKPDIIIKRRSGRSSTSASTKATEFDINEAEEIRRSRRARRAIASFSREDGWSSSSEAPLSPISLDPQGLAAKKLISTTQSQSSEGTTSSTTSQRSRMSISRSRKPSPVLPRPAKNCALQFSTDPVIHPSPLLLSESKSLMRAPSFFPTEDEFNEPLDYIEKIRPEAEHFGLCRIVPPGSFRPECRVNDEMRFTPCKQYIQRVMKRWSSNKTVMNAIRNCLDKQTIELATNPLIGSLEVDLVRLYEVVEEMGGLIKVIEGQLWANVADTLRIPKSAQDRKSKLDIIYCKYLLPYAMLSNAERNKMLDDIEKTHINDELKRDSLSEEEDDDIDEFCEFVVNGKSTSLSGFYRMSKNVANQWQPDPDGLKIDERYWKIVNEGTRHVCVHAASIDTAEHGYGFPSQKNSPSAKHPWNLKNVCQNPSSVLRSMANVIGVSAPTLHVGMMFSTVCWYRDPHSLPWIEYLHTGSRKIWYGVPSSQEEIMKDALTQIVPEFVKDSPLWLPSDATMIPPDLLIRKGLKVSRIAQEPGQFVVVFPGAFTSSVCSGYVISESAFYARPQYFTRAIATFKTLRECCEPAMFSLDRLSLSVAGDSKASLESLQKARFLVDEIVQREKRQRKQLTELGLTNGDRLTQSGSYKKKRGRNYIAEEEETLCEICKQHLYVSMVFHEEEEIGYCLHHAIIQLESHPGKLKFFKFVYNYTLPELTSTLKQMDERISLKGNRKAGFTKRTKTTEMESFSNTNSSNF